MAKKVMKMLAIMLVALMVVAVSSQAVLAKTDSSASTDLTQFDSLGDNSGASKSAQNIIGALITIVQVIGTGVAIIMLIVLAIKYISAAPGDKADIKKHAVVYVVGAIILFAATGILQIIKTFSSNISAENAK